MIKQNISLINSFMAINYNSNPSYSLMFLWIIILILYRIVKMLNFKFNITDNLLFSIVLYSTLIIPSSFFLYFLFSGISTNYNNLPRFMYSEIFVPLIFIAMIPWVILDRNLNNLTLGKIFKKKKLRNIIYLLVILLLVVFSLLSFYIILFINWCSNFDLIHELKRPLIKNH